LFVFGKKEMAQDKKSFEKRRIENQQAIGLKLKFSFCDFFISIYQQTNLLDKNL